jgi:hypothetical protein
LRWLMCKLVCMGSRKEPVMLGTRGTGLLAVAHPGDQPTLPSKDSAAAGAVDVSHCMKACVCEQKETPAMGLPQLQH